MSTPSDQIEAIVDAALDLSPADREAYLDQACGDDAALRQTVAALLRAHQHAPAPGKHPVSAPTATQRSEQSGDRIGPYKLLQRLGEGGCGVVYMAEQEEPVRRRVALKVIKLGMDTKQVIARFEAERQALALMDHPNIAKVLEAGASEAGRPYFVMELVRGTKITEYCDQNNLPTQKRLELFIQVCKAVQHAHQKGIIHRDLKPSNILVTLHDGVPVPKVIDFGIAKATEQRLTDKTVFTAFEQFIGTPAYMSPEQAEMSGLDIDTRSDIYSLGVLLYELLTSRIPFDPKELAAAGLDEMRRIIREKDPVRPSTKLSSLTVADQTTVSRQRQVEAAKLIHLVRGDLDWIVMKCLEKDRTRRYETANGLARDLERHLSNEPVVACPPSRLYRFQKMVRRNRITVAAGVSVVAALLVGVAASTWQAIRAMRAERESQQFVRFLTDMLEGVGPSVALGRDTTLLREILDKTADRIMEELKDQPRLEANLLTTIGEVYRALTANDKAEAMHRKALTIRTRLFGECHVDTATSMDLLAVVLLEQTKLGEAEPLFLKAQAIRKKLLGPDHPAVALSISNLGALRQFQGKYQEAENLYREALEVRRKLRGDDHLEVAESLICVASVLYYQQKDLPQAEEMNLKALTIRTNALGDKHPDLGVCLNNLSTVYLAQGRLDDAEATMQATIDLWRVIEKGGSAPEAQALNNLAWLLCVQGKFARAEETARAALEMRRRVRGNKHKDVAESLNMLAVILQRRGNLSEAEKLQRENLDLTIELLGSKHPDVVSAKNNLAWVFQSQRKHSEAELLLREALALHREVLGTTNEHTVQMLLNLGICCAGQGRMAQAEDANRAALAHALAAFSPDDSRVANSQLLLARLLCNRGRPSDAVEYARQGVATMEVRQPEKWSTYNAKAVLGRCLSTLGDHAGAEPLLTSGCEGMERLLDSVPVDNRLYLKEAVQSLIKLYETTGKPAEVTKWRSKLVELDEVSVAPPTATDKGNPR